MKRLILIYVSLLLLGFVSVGYVVDAFAARDDTYKYLSNFADTLELIQRNYVEEVGIGHLVDGAYRGLLEELDPDSFYLSPAMLVAYQDRSDADDRAGLGVDVSKRHGYAVVVSVLPDSPAAAENVKSGDYLRVIDGRSTRPMSLFEIEQRLAGAADSELTVKLMRRSSFEPEELTLKRARVAVPRLRSQLVDGVLVMALARVDVDTVSDVAATIRAQSELAGVVLDVRGCSRGELASGARLADLFIDDGMLLAVAGKTSEAAVESQLRRLSPKRRRAGDGYRFEVAANDGRTAWRGPLAVLTDAGTAGAAEVTTAAVQSAERGAVIGRRTFGRGTLQDLIPLDGGAVQLTVARVLHGGDDRSLLGSGVEPDEEVDEAYEDDGEDPSDPVLERALERLRDHGRKKKAA